MRLLSGRLIAVFIITTLATASPCSAVLGNDNGLDPSEATISAGVQFGVPPSGKGVADSHGCVWVPAGEAGTFEVGVVDSRVVDGVVQRLFLRACPASNVGVWVSQVSAAGLGVSGLSVVKERLPLPVLGSAPGVGDGVVNVGMWLWTDAVRYRPVSVFAWVPTVSGVVWARTTATPVRLVFESGEPGGVPVVCVGPGVVWDVGVGDEAVSDCMYTYRHSSEVVGGRFGARWSIVWSVSWRSNVSAGGDLGEFATTTVEDVTVREIQAVIVS